MNQDLETLLLQFSDAAATDLRGRLLWLEAVSNALSNPQADLGEAGGRAALDLRAALGAIIQYANGPKTPVDLQALELSVQALLARGLHTLYGALSKSYQELAEAGPNRAESKQLARLWSDLQRSLTRGRPPSPGTLRKFEALRARIDAQRPEQG